MNERFDPRICSMLHLDMDAFFAAVEIRERPELAGKPVVVGSPPDRRGVVATCNYEARAFGIHSAMPSRTAGRLCPHAVFIPPNGALYSQVSRQLMEILYSFTPLLEILSVDEAFMDVAGVLRHWNNDPVSIARAVKQAIRDRLRLTGSVGVAPNKFLAKLASDMDKPDGLTVVPTEPEALLAFLAPLPVTRIWGVGPKSAEKLRSAGFPSIGSIQATPFQALERLLGPGGAQHVWALAHGRDERPVVTESEVKSVSNEHTFDEDCEEAGEVRRVFIGLVEKVGGRLREAGLAADTVHLKLRFENFETLARQRKLAAPSHADRDLLRAGLDLLEAHRAPRAVRLIGFGVSGFGAARRDAQLSLFDDAQDSGERARNQRLDEAVDALRRQFGRRAPTRGGGQPRRSQA